MVNTPFNQTAVPAGIGEREENCHAEAGFRLANFHVITHQDATKVSGALQVFGGVGGADVLEWTELPISKVGLAGGGLPYPQTPVLFTFNAVPAALSSRWRIRGLDQFYAHQTEITPWIPFSLTHPFTVTPFSKVFSHVFRLEYQSLSVDIAAHQAAVGITNIWDPLYVSDLTNNPATAQEMQSLDNLGIGLPVRVSPYGVSQPYLHPEIMGNVLARRTGELEVDNAIIPPFDGTLSGFTVGVSAAGWQGTPHKLGFASPDAWVTKILNVDGGEFQMGGEIEVAVPPPSRATDLLEFSCLVRSALGTRREASPVTAYPLG
jgi:hypothetical protein